MVKSAGGTKKTSTPVGVLVKLFPEFRLRRRSLALPLVSELPDGCAPPGSSPNGEYFAPCRRLASGRRSAAQMRTGLRALRARSPADASIPPPKKDTPDGVSFFGGATRNRTGESRICSPLPYRLAMAPYMRFAPFGANRFCMERPTRLELATSTLARWRSTG